MAHAEQHSTSSSRKSPHAELVSLMVTKPCVFVTLWIMIQCLIALTTPDFMFLVTPPYPDPESIAELSAYSVLLGAQG
jgi:hypothetical protein